MNIFTFENALLITTSAVALILALNIFNHGASSPFSKELLIISLFSVMLVVRSIQSGNRIAINVYFNDRTKQFVHVSLYRIDRKGNMSNFLNAFGFDYELGLAVPKTEKESREYTIKHTQTWQ